jgi:hypothetical protein
MVVSRQQVAALQNVFTQDISKEYRDIIDNTIRQYT